MAEMSLHQAPIVLTDHDGDQVDACEDGPCPGHLLLTCTGSDGNSRCRSASLTPFQVLRLVAYCAEWLAAEATQKQAAARTPVQEVARG